MSLTSKTIKKYSAALYLGGKSIPLVISEAQAIVKGMTGNAWFPAPPVALTNVSTAISNLASAKVAAQTKAKGTAAAMHACAKILDAMLRQLVTYVNSVANANPNDGDTILSSAGMQQRKKPSGKGKGYRVHATKNPGELFIMTVRVKYATYDFEMTTDPTTPASWTSIYKGSKCKFVKNGLVSGTRYYIRVKVTDVSGESQPSNVLSSVVL